MVAFHRRQEAGTHWVAPLVLLLGLASFTCTHAQELVRTANGRISIASFNAPPKASLISIGPFRGEFDAGLGVDINDNAGVSESGSHARFRIQELLGVDLDWVITKANTIHLGLAGGLYEDFFNNGRKELNFSLDPTSTVDFHFEIANYRIRLYDTLSYADDPSTDQAVNNTTSLRQLTNTVGASVKTNVGFVELGLFADYTYSNTDAQNSTGNNNGFNNAFNGERHTFGVGANATLALTPTLFYGLEITGSFTSGDNNNNNNNFTNVPIGNQGTSLLNTAAVNNRNVNFNNEDVNSLSVGPFIRGKLTRLIDIELSAGPTFYDNSSVSPVGYFVRGAIRHQVNRTLQYYLAFYHDLVFSTGTNLLEDNDLSIGTQYILTREILISANVGVDFGQVDTGVNLGDFTEYHFETRLDWKLNKRLTSSVGYRYTNRDSDALGNSFSQNRIQIQFTYAF